MYKQLSVSPKLQEHPLASPMDDHFEISKVFPFLVIQIKISEFPHFLALQVERTHGEGGTRRVSLLQKTIFILLG